jgi:hypothetical protein
MYRTILFPDKKNHSIELPEEFYGKKVKVTVVEVTDALENWPTPPAGKKIDVSELFEDFGAAPDWPSKW